MALNTSESRRAELAAIQRDLKELRRRVHTLGSSVTMWSEDAEPIREALKGMEAASRLLEAIRPETF